MEARLDPAFRFSPTVWFLHLGNLDSGAVSLGLA